MTQTAFLPLHSKGNMGTKVCPPSTDSEKIEIGERDTRAPFESVKAAVSLFGEVRFSSDKSAARKAKAPQAEVIYKARLEHCLARDREHSRIDYKMTVILVQFKKPISELDGPVSVQACVLDYLCRVLNSDQEQI